MNIKCVITDIDGTLLNDKKELTIDNYKAIKRLKEKGIYFILASGRYLETVDVNLDYWNIREYVDYIIYNNGYGLYDVKNKIDKTFENLDQKYCEDIVNEILKSNLDIGIYEYRGNKINSTKLNGLTKRRQNVAQVTIVDPSYFYSKAFPKLSMTYDEEIEKEAISLAFKIAKDKAYYTFSSGTCVYEFLNRKVSKAKTALRLIESLKIKNEETIVFGDNDNDIEMLEVFINSVAMANATENAKKAAKDLTISNNDSGIADYLSKYLL